MKKKRRIIFRISEFNRLSYPILLNVWEKEGLDTPFEIQLQTDPLTPSHMQAGDVVLFSFMTSVLPDIHREIEAIRSSGVADLLLVGGGPHITGEQELSRKIGLDTLFIGPAEQTFKQFGLDLLDNHPIPPVYQDSTPTDIHTQATAFNRYIPVSRYTETIPPLEIMRGCYWHCKYCTTPSSHVHFRTLDSIELFLQEMKKRDHIRVNVISPSAMEYGAPKGRKIALNHIEALLNLIASYQFRFTEYGIFPSEVRPDTVTPEGMSLLKKFVINKSITIGAQSALDERLKELHRGHNVADIVHALEIANANGFLVNLDFIVGYPDETPEERLYLVEFIKTLTRRFRIRTHLHHFIPLSGSPYAFRFPGFMSTTEKEPLFQLKKAGITSDGWITNEIQAQEYFSWLKNHFPAFYQQYA